MASTNSKDRIFFPGTNRPIAFFFVIVPVVTTIVAGICVYKYKLPIALIGLILLLIGSCVVLAKAALFSLGDTTIELTAQELKVQRLIGSASYNWSDIESVKLIDPGVTFCDNALEDEKRAGIGLILRKTDRKEAPSDDTPDVLVVVRAGDDVLKVTKAFERINAMKRGGSGARGGKPGASPQKAFRKTAAAA